MAVFISRNSFRFLLVFVVILSILYSTLSIVRHNHFQSGGFDLGLFDQSVWRYAHLLPPYNTVKDQIILGDHFTLTLPLFGLLFYLWNDVRMLLIAQAVLIAASVIPIFYIAKKRLKSECAAMFLAMIYGLFYGIQYGVYFDFHPILIGAALLPWIAYCWEYGKKKLFWITLVLALATQENMGIAVTGLSLIFFFRKEFRTRAILVGVTGILYSLLSAKIAAQLSPHGYQYWPQLPTSLSQAVTRLFDSEEKQQVWWYSYLSYSFIPLLSPGSILAVLLDLSQYFVTGPEFARMWSPYMHHRAILSPFLALGTIDVLVFLKTKRIRIEYIVLGMFIIAMITQYIYHFPLNKLTKNDYWKEEPWMADTRKLISMTPQAASVATQQNLVPYLSHRKEIYLVWPRVHDIKSKPCGRLSCWWLDWGGNPQYLVVDTRPDQWLTQILETNEHWMSAISNMEKDGRITLINHVGGARLYRILRK